VPSTISPFLLFNWKEILFGLVFCILLVYGLSAVVYFTLEFVNPKSLLSTISKGVFYSNLNNGVGALISVYIFINVFEFKVQPNWAKYLILIGITSVYVLIFSTIMNYLYWQHIDRSSWGQFQSNDSIIYIFLPIIVSCAYFFYWQRTRSITRKISEQEYQLLNLKS
jgi:hypothetical protein